MPRRQSAISEPRSRMWQPVSATRRRSAANATCTPRCLTSYLDGNLVLEIKSAVERQLRDELSGLKPEEAAVLAMLRNRLSREASAHSSHDDLPGALRPQRNAQRTAPSALTG